MCLAVPMKIVEIRSDGWGVVDMDGTRYDANLALVEDPQVGQYVIVHAGYAIETLDPEDAEERISLFEQMAELYRGEQGKGPEEA